MMSFIAGIMMLAAVAIPPFPFTTYDSVTGARPTGQTMCSGTAAVVTAPNWYIISTQARDIFMHVGTDGEPDFVYFVVDNSNGGPITVRFALTIDEAKRRYPNPCMFFLEKDV